MPDIDIDFAVDGRERVINYVADKYGRDRVAQIITFSTMAASAAVRDAGRVLEVPYGVVDRIAKLIPEGPGQTLAEALKPGGELRSGRRLRAGRQGDRRPRAAARGPDACRLDPRRRRRHRRAAADRARAAPAEGGRPGGRDAVLDEQRRGARAAEDGLPRPAQPRRHRHGRRADRERRRHRRDPDRRPEDVRDAPPCRRRRRLPVRVVGHAGRAAGGEADGVRGPDRARRALPAWADAEHPRLRRPQERQGAGDVHRRAAEADHRHDVRHHGLPGADHGDRQGGRRVLARRGGRPAQGDRQEDPLADGVAEGEVPRRLRRRTASRRRSQRGSGRRPSGRRTTPSTSRTPPATR